MGTLIDEANSVYRDYVTDGVPASGPNNPDKPAIRALFADIINAITGVSSGLASYATAAALQATTPAAGQPTLAVVTSDPTATNNGYWQYAGGAWTILSALNAALKGAPGLMAAAANADYDAGTSNVLGVTPAGLSYLGLTSGLLTFPVVAGKSSDPANGTALNTSIAVLATPVPTKSQLQSVRLYVKATGTITISRWSKSGTTATLIASYPVTVSTTGLVTLTSANFGTIPLNAGEYLGLAGSGVGVYNNVTGAASYWLFGAGSTTGSTASPSSATTFEWQFNYNSQPLSATAYVALVASLANIPAGSQVIGRPVDPIDGSAVSNTAFVMYDPVAASGVLSSFKFYAHATGSVQVVRYTKSGSNFAVVGVSQAVAVSSTGLKTLTAADYGVLLVNAGEYLGVVNAGVLAYTQTTSDGNGYALITGAGNVTGQSYASGTQVLNVRPEISLNITSGAVAILGALQSEIVALQSQTSTTTTAPLHTTGKSLFIWRAKVAKFKRAGTGKFKALMLGDSWLQKLAIPQQLANILYAAHGKAGEGWVSSTGGGDEQNGLNGVTVTYANWTEFDAGPNSGTEPAVPAFGCAHDGKCIYTTGTTATYTVSNFAATEVRLFYAQSTGSFRYQIDSGAWTTVTGDGSNGLGVASLTGLAAGTHTLNVDTSVNGGGTVAIFGAYLTNTAGIGVEVLKCGNSNMSGEQLATYVSSYVTPIVTNIAPDAAIVAMGTNDYRRSGSSPATLVASYRQLVAACRAAVPGLGFVFVAPALTNATPVTGTLAQYRDAVWAMCQADGHDFYSHYDDFSTYAAENALGMWTDALHLTDDGAYRLASRINNSLLGL